MSDSLTKDMQTALMPMFYYFREVCEANNIKYSLAYGTMLGAVRHSGFIPWDDDIDIFMTRAEYYKLKTIFASEKYEILDYETDANYPYMFPKLRDKNTVLIEKNISDINYNIGIYIDIFVLDETSKGFAGFFKKLKLKINYKLFRLTVLNLDCMNGLQKFLARIVRHFTDYRKTNKKCNTVFLKSKGKYLRDISMPKSSYYLKKEEMEQFEAIRFEENSFKISANYHDILTRHFGNYMELPKEEDRRSNHSFAELKL